MAAANINITINDAQFAKLKADLDPKQLKQAMYQAVKRTTAFAEKQVKGDVKQTTFMQPKYINRAIDSKVTKSDPPVGVVTISQRMIPLVGYKARATKGGGAIAQVSKNRAPIVLRHGFRARVRSAQQATGGFEGHMGIFLRAKRLPSKGPNVGRKRLKLTKKGFAGRLAIEEQFGPSVLNLIEVPATLQRVAGQISDQLEKNVQSQLDRFTK